ncbi:MAG TPA: RecQ family ATP-dependent DNA helicase [Tepidisphaeraceae bacterium]
MARERFGYEEMRPGQEQVIRLILEGKDTLSIMPTGSGKSAIYQIAGLFVDGPTVVISPLIALQKDQVDSIDDKNLPSAAVVNSSQRVAEKREALAALANDELEFLFLSPEQLANADTFARLAANPPSLFVIDEAHCVSEWGHDFRPEYGRIGSALDQLPKRPRIVALTATASPNVRDDIIARLGMKHPEVVVWGFDRPNIHLAVEACPDEETKTRLFLQRIEDLAKPAIVYVATRQHAEDLTKMLEGKLKAGFYHAGMKKDERTAMQDAFMADELDVIIATNAFGMGVDKPDVRTVIHYDISDSIDSYYQEIGRAGRDGEPSKAIMLYRPEDLGFRKAMAAGGKLSESQLEQVAEAIADRHDPAPIKDVAEAVDMPQGKVEQAINRLSEVGAVTVLPGGEVKPAGKKMDAAGAAEEAAQEHESYRQYRMGRVALMKDYAETKDCRRRYILNYFGEPHPEPCGFCDNCDAGISQKEQAKEEDAGLPFALKSRVAHKKFGEGTIMRYEKEKVVILFDTEGEKALVTDVVVNNELLKTL